MPRAYSVNQIYFLQHLTSHLSPSRNTHFLTKRRHVAKKEVEVFKVQISLFKRKKTFGRTCVHPTSMEIGNLSFISWLDCTKYKLYRYQVTNPTKYICGSNNLILDLGVCEDTFYLCSLVLLTLNPGRAHLNMHSAMPHEEPCFARTSNMKSLVYETGSGKMKPIKPPI